MNKDKKLTENHIHIKDWPEGDRPREMLLEKGPEALSDAALLAILLRTGRQGKDAVGLAREMLTEFDGFRGLMSATYEDLLRTKGIGKAKIAQIPAAKEIVKRQLRQPLNQLNVIQNPNDLFDYLKVSMGNLSKEEFRVLHLNRSKHLIAEEVLFKERIPRYDKRIGVTVKNIRISDLGHRWASCGRNGTINFNWRSVMAPVWVFDYILVHELVHLIERGHTARFWGMVARVMPEYEEHARWLNENGADLDL